MPKAVIEPQTFIEKLTSALRSVYEDEAKLIVERHKEEISKELDDKMTELVMRAGLKIEDRIMIDSFGKELKITIYKKQE